MAVTALDMMADRGVVDKLLAERSFHSFVKQAWKTVLPAAQFVDNWHIQAIADHLQRMSEGAFQDLVINLPPRHGKSTICSVMWPVWMWINKPHFRWVTCSYAEELSGRDALESRRLIESVWFQQRWGDRFKLSPDQNQKLRYDNNRSGYRVAASVNGMGTGWGGSGIIIDDPLDASGITSDVAIAKHLDWWDNKMSSRLDDPSTGIRLLVMQRLKDNDLSGHLLEQGWNHLCLPAEFEVRRKCVVQVTGWSDPRTEEGELLWKGRFKSDFLEKQKVTLRSNYSGQYQQNPSPSSGIIFDPKWFERVAMAPPLIRVVRGWDKAATEKTGDVRDPDWTAGVKIGIDSKGTYYIMDARRIRASYLGVENYVKATASQDGRGVRIRLEQEPGSSGKGEAQRYVREVLSGYTVKALPATGDKVERAAGLASAAEAGLVKVVRGDWVETFLDEMSFFPGKGKHDDQVDAAANAFNELATVVELESGFWTISA